MGIVTDQQLENLVGGRLRLLKAKGIDPKSPMGKQLMKLPFSKEVIEKAPVPEKPQVKPAEDGGS